MENELFKKISSFIIDTVSKNSESSMSGFQYCVDYSIIQEMFACEIQELVNDMIVGELEKRCEIADVELDTDGFDVVLYTDYAENYISEDDDCGGYNNKDTSCYKCGYVGDNPWHSIIIEYNSDIDDYVSEPYSSDDVDSELRRISEKENGNNNVRNIFISGGFCPNCLAGDFE